MAISTSKIMTVFFILSLTLPSTLATVYEVCGDLGWSTIDIAHVSLWLGSLPVIHVGDTFHFSFVVPTTVAVVDLNGYLNCDASHAVTNDKSGSFSYTFKQSGLFWFISDGLNDCDAGLKLQVLVL